MDINDHINFKDFAHFYTNFAAEDIIHKHAQMFKQKLIDSSDGKTIDLQSSDNLEMVFREFFIASMLANLDVLGTYHQFVVSNLEGYIQSSIEHQLHEDQ